MSEEEFTALVERMTNWERNQWARAGYPGLNRIVGNKIVQSKDVAILREYLDRAAQAKGEK